MERAAFASMLLSARDGNVESESAGRRWSVVVQQAASFVAQAGRRGRRRSDLLELADDVWPGGRKTVGEICDELLESGHLEENRERIFLGEPWANAFEAGERGMHGNLGSPTGGIPVVDSSTGETIAHVSQAPETEKGIALGGQTWNARFANGEVWLTARVRGQQRGQFRYAARRGPLGAEYAAHVRRGLGFDERDAPVALIEENPVWLHFGGGAYEAVLASLLPSVRKFAGMNGLAMAGHPEAPRRAAKARCATCWKSCTGILNSFWKPAPFNDFFRNRAAGARPWICSMRRDSGVGWQADGFGNSAQATGSGRPH